MALAEDLGVNDDPSSVRRMSSDRQDIFKEGQRPFSTTKRNLQRKTSRYCVLAGTSALTASRWSSAGTRPTTKGSSLLSSPEKLLWSPDDFPGPVGVPALGMTNRALHFAAVLILKYSSGKGVTKGTFRTSVDGEAGFIEVSTPVSLRGG